MMLAYRLVRLIETHSDGLATGLLARVQSSEFARDYCKVPTADLQERVYVIYRHLGEWLLGKAISTSGNVTWKLARAAPCSRCP